MHAVNLLPRKHRPATPTGERSGSSYVLLGVLGAMLVAVVLYVMSANAVSTKKEEISKAQQETAEAEQKTRHLQPYGDFSTVAETRVSSVRQQAQGRVDWDRLVRELAHLLPDGVWLTSADAAADPAMRQGGSQNTEITGPSIVLLGCAQDQGDVATTLVRLRRISGATDVRLAESKQGDNQNGPSSGQANPEDCGEYKGKPNYSWNATVLFDANAAASSGGADTKVPARLGGGS